MRDEKKQHCFAEVPQDAHHSKGHASKVAESVPNKHLGWVPAVRRAKEQRFVMITVSKKMTL